MCGGGGGGMGWELEWPLQLTNQVVICTSLRGGETFHWNFA